MKNLILFIVILSLSNCTKSQSWEKGICECIEANYNLNTWNYFGELQSFEKEMIKRGKFSETIESKIELLNKLGDLEYVPFYKYHSSIRFLNFGEQSIAFCIKRELYKRDSQKRHWSEKLIKKLNYHKAKLLIDGSLKSHNKNMANSIITAIKNNNGDNRLKNLFILKELYRRIPDQAGYNLDQSKLEIFEAQKVVKSETSKRNIINVVVNQGNEIYIKDKLITLEMLSDTIQKIILNKNNNPNFPKNPKEAIIALRNSRETSYKLYLDVYSELKKAYAELRTEMSQELYDKLYDSLSKKEKEVIRSELPLVISESTQDDN